MKTTTYLALCTIIISFSSCTHNRFGKTPPTPESGAFVTQDIFRSVIHCNDPDSIYQHIIDQPYVNKDHYFFSLVEDTTLPHAAYDLETTVEVASRVLIMLEDSSKTECKIIFNRLLPKGIYRWYFKQRFFTDYRIDIIYTLLEFKGENWSRGKRFVFK